MSRKSSSLLFGAWLALVACAAGTVLITRAAIERESSLATAQVRTTVADTNRARNLALQPEAQQVARHLGKRFHAGTLSTTVLIGGLTVAGSEQPMTITRRQSKTGETVELLIGNRSITWSDQEGTKSTSGLPTDTERLLVERLTLDSPDEFVLAQLRGASYFTFVRNLRPTNAGENYRGPLWTLIRVSEPQGDDRVRPLSLWRIYYLNVQTGLPDRIQYQLNGYDIRVDFADWTEQNGEKTPARITWSSGGQTLMEYKVVSVSFNQ
jgi:hypothetical protein